MLWTIIVILLVLWLLGLIGNIGGGLGSLRAMSSLCADSRPVGFNVSRKVADQGYRKDRLIRIDHIPTTKLGLIGMFLRFKLFHRDRSVGHDASCDFEWPADRDAASGNHSNDLECFDQ